MTKKGGARGVTDKTKTRWESSRQSFGFGRCPFCETFKRRSIYLGPKIGCVCTDCGGPQVSSAEMSRRVRSYFDRT